MGRQCCGGDHGGVFAHFCIYDNKTRFVRGRRGSRSKSIKSNVYDKLSVSNTLPTG